MKTIENQNSEQQGSKGEGDGVRKNYNKHCLTPCVEIKVVIKILSNCLSFQHRA